MKTNMAPNSLAAFWQMRDAGELPEREREVYEALRKYGPMTREQLAARTGQKEGSIAGRVFKLKERGIVVGVANKINPHTDKLNEIVDLAPHRKTPKVQEPLFPEMVAA
jgi:DNA-binding Lrp family transcriptional regulator